MMRKKIEEKQDLSLKELIPLYGETKEQADKYDKAAKEQNKQIKIWMKKLKKDEQTVDGWTAKYSVRTSESFNESALIEYLKSHKEFDNVVKLKEYVDEEALADLLYKNKIPKKLVLALDKFRVQKQTEYLTITKAKEES